MSSLSEEVKQRIISNELIPEGGHVVCGVSGGPDSLCMLHILDSLRSELGYTISVVHINHLFRAEESDADEWFIEKLCKEMELPFTAQRINITEIAKMTGQTFEEAGREARYEAFDMAALTELKKRNTNANMIRIAVGHNMNDQVETIMMRIIRGTGPDGLAGMETDRFTKSGFSIIRPLLGAERNEIEDHCALCGLFPRIDRTNYKRIAMRNKLRLDLLPMICENYNSSFEDALIRLGHIAADYKAYFDKLISGIIAEHGNDIPDNSENHITLPLDILVAAELPIRHRLIINVFNRLGLIQDIEYTHLTAADDLILSGQTGRGADFPGGYRLEIEYDKAVFLIPEISEQGIIGSFAVAITDVQRSEKGIMLFEGSPAPMYAEILNGSTEVLNAHADQLLLDFDALIAENRLLVLRSRNPGDRISLLGMKGTRKIQDILVDEKIPRRERDSIPIIATENEVLWLIRIRKTRSYPVINTTKRILRLIPE